MRTLVTGASGTIGSALVARLLEKGHDVVCQSREPRSSDHSERWLTFNLADAPDTLSESGRWDSVFHLAARTSAAAARDDPLGAVMDNVTALISLLEGVRRYSTPFVVIAGTSTQVGLPKTTRIHEALCDDPVTFYDVTKQAAEMVLRQYVREGWVTGCCLRLATVYGATGAKQASDRGVIDKVMRSALSGQDVTVFGDGDYLRDYIHVKDVVEAFVAAASNPEAVNGKAFVVGTGKGITVKEAFGQAVQVAAQLTGSRVDIKHVPAPEGMSPIEFRNAVIDSAAFMEATGWSPRFDLRSGLMETYGGEAANRQPVRRK